MCDVNVSRLVDDVDPFDLSHSIAEGGQTAGRDTWRAAKAEAEARPLDIADRDAVKEYFAGFGAWDREEIAAWSDADLDALVLQFAAGDLRTLQDIASGDEFAGIDWGRAEALAEAGAVSGNLYTLDGCELWISLAL